MNILLKEDNADFRSTLCARLAEAGIDGTAEGLETQLEPGSVRRDYDLVILGGETDAVREIMVTLWPTPCIRLLNDPDIDAVTESVRAGAFAVIDRSQPAESVVQRISALCQSLGQSKEASSPGGHFAEGQCPKMRALEHLTQRVAATQATVLIVGETGTGKELTARRVHALSARCDKPMITVNCAAIPETLIESELFGYEKGAFTGATSSRVGLIEAADGGTLFLDEIGELPLAAQARLLRFLQEGEIRRIGSTQSKTVDTRLVCATHRDLAALTRSGDFRHDLLYRIDVLKLEIPPLRDRGDDILRMAKWFAAHLPRKLAAPERPLSASALQFIAAHPWHGNVRELQNMIERAIVMSEGEELLLETPAPPMSALAPPPKIHSAPLQSTQSSSEELSLEEYFQRFVLEHQDAMNETELAQKLGISRKCLWERRQRFGIARKKQKSA